MYPRHITQNLLAALRDTPVVVLHGPRQAGKSTLAQHLTKHGHSATYITLDNATALATAKTDPTGFLAGIQGPLVLDEIQRAPELVLPIKADVDRNRRPGRFLLTGSANILQLPKLADALVGRMEVLTLRPLSQGEIAGVREGFIDALFSGKLPSWSDAGARRAGAISKAEMARRILTGGYPEAVKRRGLERRRQWFEGYLNTVMMRDVRDLSNIEGLVDLPRLMTAVAGRAGGLLNYADLGRDVGLNQVTTKRYLALLRATFVVQALQPWFTNRIKRVVKSEKLYLGDTGLLAYLLDATSERFVADPKLTGMLTENFVAVELMKQATWSRTRPSLWHFRDHRGNEVDFVLEARGGTKIVGVEVKSRATLDSDDFNGVRVLAEAAGERFHRGIVLYSGVEALPFGKQMHALPITALWHLGAET